MQRELVRDLPEEEELPPTYNEPEWSQVQASPEDAMDILSPTYIPPTCIEDVD